VLHSAVSGPDSGEGELKLYGRAAEADDEVRVEAATFVEWRLERGEMVVRRWSPRRGLSRRTRPYP
jgi:hypothetical protein